jgi:peptidylprolyl isomerase
MVPAKLGDTVIVHYTGKLEDGTEFDSSIGKEPLQFRLGEGEVIPGFDAAVVGMAPGESKTQLIPAEEAYGPHMEDMVIAVDRQQIPPDMPVELGIQLQLQDPSGQVIPVTVVEVDDEAVVLDANHPLAGEDLTFEIQLVAVI